MMSLRRRVFIIKGGRAVADASFLSSSSLTSSLSSSLSSSESSFISSRRSIGTGTKFNSGTTTKTTSSSLSSREVGKDDTNTNNNNNKERDENERRNATTIQTIQTTGKTNGRRSTSNYRREIQKRLMEATSKTMKKTEKRRNESASWKRTLRLKRSEKMDNRECWTVKEFIEKNCLSSAAYSASDTDEDEDEMEADDDDFTMTMMEAEDIEEEAVLAMLRKSARAAALAERREEESLKDGDDDSDNSDLAAYYNYVNAVKNSKDDGFSNVHYYSDADEDEIEAKLESIQGLLDALREEEDKEEEERTTTNNNNSKARANKLESLQTIMDQVYSFREQQQQLALLPEIVVGRTSKSKDLDANDLDGNEDENARGSVGGTIFRADSVKRKRKKAMNKHKHRKRKKKDRFKNK